MGWAIKTDPVDKLLTWGVGRMTEPLKPIKGELVTYGQDGRLKTEEDRIRREQE